MNSFEKTNLLYTILNLPLLSIGTVFQAVNCPLFDFKKIWFVPSLLTQTNLDIHTLSNNTWSYGGIYFPDDDFFTSSHLNSMGLPLSDIDIYKKYTSAVLRKLYNDPSPPYTIEISGLSDKYRVACIESLIDFLSTQPELVSKKYYIFEYDPQNRVLALVSKDKFNYDSSNLIDLIDYSPISKNVTLGSKFDGFFPSYNRHFFSQSHLSRSKLLTSSLLSNSLTPSNANPFYVLFRNGVLFVEGPGLEYLLQSSLNILSHYFSQNSSSLNQDNNISISDLGSFGDVSFISRPESNPEAFSFSVFNRWLRDGQLHHITLAHIYSVKSEDNMLRIAEWLETHPINLQVVGIGSVFDSDVNTSYYVVFRWSEYEDFYRSLPGVENPIALHSTLAFSDHDIHHLSKNSNTVFINIPPHSE